MLKRKSLRFKLLKVLLFMEESFFYYIDISVFPQALFRFSFLRPRSPVLKSPAAIITFSFAA